jgi:hypothetical protein
MSPSVIGKYPESLGEFRCNFVPVMMITPGAMYENHGVSAGAGKLPIKIYAIDFVCRHKLEFRKKNLI